MASCWFSWIFHSLKIPICFYLKSKAKNIPQSISISLYKRPEELKTASLHTHTHTFTHTATLSLRLLSPFSQHFVSKFPSRPGFLSQACASFPGSSTTMPCFISALQDLRRLEPMSGKAHAKAISQLMMVVSRRGITKTIVPECTFCVETRHAACSASGTPITKQAFEKEGCASHPSFTC